VWSSIEHTVLEQAHSVLERGHEREVMGAELKTTELRLWSRWWRRGLGGRMNLCMEKESLGE
jgi:hypothetical protein